MKKMYITALCLLFLGMGSLVKAQYTIFNTSNSNIPSNSVSGGVAIDKNNNIWLGTQDAGVVKYDGANWTIFNAANNGLPSDVISCVAVDTSNNNIWIGTVGDGVAKYDGSTWTTYSYANGLCDNGIFSIAIDKDDNVWFASWGAGISKLSGSTWTTYSSELPNDQGAIASVYYIYVDASNNKWFGTSLGLVKYDGTTFTTIDQTTAPNLQSSYINTITVDSINNIWVGVGSNGISKFNSSNTWVQNDTTGFCDKTIRDIKIDSKGYVWTGEHTIYGSKIVGGITKFNTNTNLGISYASTLDSLGSYNDQVYNIAIDKSDNIWIGTGNNGLLKFTAPSGISVINSQKQLDIYPNPVQEYLVLNAENHSGVIEISDISGRVVLSQQISSPAKINTEKFVKGVYFIRFTEKNEIYEGKFIKD